MRASCVLVAFLVLAVAPMRSQTAAPAGQGCALEVKKFNPAFVSIRVHNVSGKTIVGLSFYAALADATEHWKWVRSNYDNGATLREFGWNREVKPDETKTLSWDSANLDFDHGGGGVFVLTSVLYADGSHWEEPLDGNSCETIWFNSHKKAFFRPIELPLRR